MKKNDDTRKKKRPQDNHVLLSARQKEEIKKAFDYFDISGSGVIDASNLKVVLRALGFDLNNEEIYKLLRGLDEESNENVDNKIDFQKFLQIIIVKISEKESDENLRKSFGLFEDIDKRGKFTKDGQQQFISKASLMRVIKSLDEDMTEEEAEELIIRAINKNELLRMGEIKNDEKGDNKDYDSVDFMVTCKDFMKILNEDFVEANKF
jgi:calcium-binding protein CML